MFSNSAESSRFSLGLILFRSQQLLCAHNPLLSRFFCWGSVSRHELILPRASLATLLRGRSSRGPQAVRSSRGPQAVTGVVLPAPGTSSDPSQNLANSCLRWSEFTQPPGTSSDPTCSVALTAGGHPLSLVQGAKTICNLSLCVHVAP